MWRRRRERGESILEVAGYLALVGAIVAVGGYFVVYANDDSKLTAAQQAYVVAVATQRADAYIRAVATQAAGAPPPREAVAPRAPVPAVAVAPPPQAPPALVPTSPPPVAAAPYVPPPPAPTAAPPPPPVTKPPMAACVGFMVGLTTTGVEACQQLVVDKGVDVRVRNCIGHLLAGDATSGAGQADCVGASLAVSGTLADCFLGLSGQSLYGRTSCRQYYGSQ